MNQEDGRVANGTYDGDPSRHERFTHGAGVVIAVMSGLGLLAMVVIGTLFWHPLTTAWFGG